MSTLNSLHRHHTDQSKATNQLRWVWLSLFIFALDQFSKFWVLSNLTLGEPRIILPVFNLEYIPNLGASYGFLSHAGGWQRWLFIGIAIVISLFILQALYQLLRKNNGQACALALILGGAAGNLFDRLVHPYVVDFIQVHYNNWYFPTFNVADSAITVGVIIWLLITLFHPQSGVKAA